MGHELFISQCFGIKQTKLVIKLETIIVKLSTWITQKTKSFFFMYQSLHQRPDYEDEKNVEQHNYLVDVAANFGAVVKSYEAITRNLLETHRK